MDVFGACCKQHYWSVLLPATLLPPHPEYINSQKLVVLIFRVCLLDSLRSTNIDTNSCAENNAMTEYIKASLET